MVRRAAVGLRLEVVRIMDMRLIGLVLEDIAPEAGTTRL